MDDDVTKLQPLDEMMRIVGSEVKLRLSKSDEGVDGKSPSLEVELELVHVFGDPETHPVNYGAAATTAAERLRLSAPLSIFDQLEWSGTVVVHAQEPTLVANVLRRTQSPQNPAAANRCLVFLKQAPLP